MSDIPQNWKNDPNRGLVRDFEFPDFKSAWEKLNSIAALAEEKDHHPDLSLSWGKLGVSLISHDQGKVTDRDVTMAHAIEALEN